MLKIIRLGGFCLALVVPTLVAGIFGTMASYRTAMAVAPDQSTTFSEVQLPLPAYDPTKPTAVVLLGNDLTEVTDFLAPYELLAVTQRFNLYALAPQHQLTTLTGGLDVIPHLSLAEYDSQIKANPALIVIPQIPNIKSEQNRPLLNWLKMRANPQTILLSWCTGAGVLAETGLLNGQRATTHWGDIDRLEREYSQVQWVRGVRYVDNGNLVTAAGLTSGYDATLHVLERLFGIEVAKLVAAQLHYPSYKFVDAPQMQQYKVTPGDSIYVFNSAFKWEKANAGVLLYDGVGETELAAVMDTYAASFTTRLFTAAASKAIIKSRHGLYLVPRQDLDQLARLDRLLVVGGTARTNPPRGLTDWAKRSNTPLVYLNADQPQRFAFDAPLEDLARQQDVPTAQLAMKRLEYRASGVQLEGSGWPLWVLLRPVFIAGISFGLVLLCYRFWRWNLRNKSSR